MMGTGERSNDVLSTRRAAARVTEAIDDLRINVGIVDFEDLELGDLQKLYDEFRAGAVELLRLASRVQDRIYEIA